MRYVFEDYELDMQLYELRQNGQPIKLEPQEFNVLAYLIEHRDKIVTKEELLEQVWPDQFVSESVLSQRIMTIRKALGESGRAPRYLKTIHGRGYRFTAESHIVTPKPVSDEVHDADRPGTWSCSTQAPATPSLLPQETAQTTDALTTPSSSPPGMTERRQLTILFCDLVGSTSLSEQLDPEDLDAILQAYYATCDQVLNLFGGHVAQYLGDGLLIYFGYPQAQEDAARRAVHTGLHIIDAMSKLNRRLERDHGIQLAVRIGIHTGLVVIGQGRGLGYAEDLAVGATPNIASRIQALSAPNTISISETTAALIDGYFITEALGSPILTGLSEPMKLYRVMAARDIQSRLDSVPAERLTPFVGRETELVVLRDRWRQAQHGYGQVAWVSGEAGIGKSRLVRAVSESSTPHLVLEGGCSPYHQYTAYYPIINLLKRYLDIDEQAQAQEKIETIAQLMQGCQLDEIQGVSLLSPLLGFTPPTHHYPALGLSPQEQRQHTLELLVNIVIALSQSQPVLLILEDVHWLDPSTLEWLDLLVDQGPTASIFTLLTSRPEWNLPWLGRAHVMSLTLNRLSPSSIAQMIHAVTGADAVSTELIDRIVATTDGVPLFVEEVTKWLIASNTTPYGDPPDKQGTTKGHHKIPTTLQDLLTTRLDAVGEAKRTAQLGATVGREFSRSLLQMISPLSEEHLQSDLDTLMSADLLYQRGIGEQAIYQFKHALIQDAAYQSLLQRRRQHLHLQIAEVFEHHFPDLTASQPEAVARQYTAAAMYQPAATWWLRAAQRSKEVGSHAESEGHARHLLEVTLSLTDGENKRTYQMDALALLGDLASLRGDVETANQHYERLLGLVPPPPLRRSIENRFHHMHRVENEGVRIAYYTHGRSGETLVFVNPIVYGFALFQPVVERLCQDFQVITIDCRGTGNSGPLVRPCRLDQHVRDLAAVIEDLACDSVVGVGLSIGGNQLIKLDQLKPGVLSHLVLIGTPVDNMLEDSPVPRSASFNERQQDALDREDWETVIEMFSQTLFSEPAVRNVAQQFIAMCHQVPIETLKSFFDLDPSVDVRALLSDLSVPTLIVHGTEDRRVPYETAPYLQERIPTAQLYPFTGKGHLPLFTAPDEFCDTLRKFVREGII